VFSLNLFSDYALEPTNLKISGNLDPTFYYSGKLSIFRYLLPYLPYRPPNAICLPPYVNFPSEPFSHHRLSLQPFRKIHIFSMKILLWKKIIKRGNFQLLLWFALNWASMILATNQSYSAIIVICIQSFTHGGPDSIKLRPVQHPFPIFTKFYTKPVQSQNFSTDFHQILHQPTQPFTIKFWSGFF